MDTEHSLYIVADGMGGHEGGEVASAMTVDVIRREIGARLPAIRTHLQNESVEARTAARQEVSQSIALACKEVFNRSRSEPELRGMGTTVAVLLVVGDQGIVAHVGDSRIYQLRDGQCNQLTEDHSLLQEHLRHGLITPEEARNAKWGNVISRAVGTHPTVKPDTLHIELMSSDEFVICSDGLHGYLADGELAGLVAGCDPKAATRKLIAIAKERGGKDNVSVIDVRTMAEIPVAAPSFTPSDKIKALGTIPLFAKLDYKELVTIVNIFSVRSFAAGQDVVVEGASGDEMFIVLSGAVEVRKGGTALATLRRLKHFGEMALADNEPRSATVTAVEPAKLMVIRRDDFVNLVQRDAEIGVKLLWSLVHVLSERLRDTTRHAALPGAHRA